MTTLDPGQYRIRFTTSESDAESSTAEGTLFLRAVEPRALGRTGWARETFVGHMDVDLESIGAVLLGPVDSDDPDAPGVVVVEPTNDEEPMRLSLGSGRNRRDLRVLDGRDTRVKLTRVSHRAFEGTWRSRRGAGPGVAFGTFEAQFLDQPPPENPR